MKRALVVVESHFLFNLKNFLKKKLKDLLSLFDLSIIKTTNLESIQKNIKNTKFINLLTTLLDAELNIKPVLKNRNFSHSQSFQDLFILSIFKNQPGFFIEAGACDGKYLSNTYMLEKKFNWKGLLVEPNRFYWKNLTKNRNCEIFKGAIGNKNGIYDFIENTSPELSHLRNTNVTSKWSEYQDKKKINKIKVLNFIGLVNQYKIEGDIDYLSLDLEGAELDFLKSIDFNNIKINVITVEHNFESQRDQIYKLLTNNGFNRVFEEISQQDDWYINKQFLNFFPN